MSEDIRLTHNVVIPGEELQFQFVRSGGPGGQNVNKVATKVMLRLDVLGSSAIPETLKEMLRVGLARRLLASGEVVVSSDRFREQSRNRALAVERLGDLLRAALERPKPRRATRPTRGSRERRHAAKRRRSQVKQHRRQPNME